VLVCCSLIHAIITFNANPVVEIVLLPLHFAIIGCFAIMGCSIFYLRVAAKMSRREAGAFASSRWLCLLTMASFPLFPIGLFCIPLFPIIGILSFRKVRRYYFDYCKMTEL